MFHCVVRADPDPNLYIAFSYTPEERLKNLERIGFVAAELARAGAAVVAAPIAPSQVARDAVKDTVIHAAGAGGNFFTIHVATPLEFCEAHDRRNVYSRARKGELKNVPGVNEEYETPERPDLTVDLSRQSVPEIVHSEWPFVRALFSCADRVFRHCPSARDPVAAVVVSFPRRHCLPTALLPIVPVLISLHLILSWTSRALSCTAYTVLHRKMSNVSNIISHPSELAVRTRQRCVRVCAAVCSMRTRRVGAPCVVTSVIHGIVDS